MNETKALMVKNFGRNYKS